MDGIAQEIEEHKPDNEAEDGAVGRPMEKADPETALKSRSCGIRRREQHSGEDGVRKIERQVSKPPLSHWALRCAARAHCLPRADRHKRAKKDRNPQQAGGVHPEAE